MPPPQEPGDAIRDLAALTPSELDADIRAAAIEVYVRIEAWRASACWSNGREDRRGYAAAVLAIADVDDLPEAVDYTDLWRLVRALAPILNHPWPEHPGRERGLAEAVERLREIAVGRLRSAEDARRITGRDTR
jgi:hypothetical protein